MTTTPLSLHFTLEEMIASPTAVARGLNNIPEDVARAHLVQTAEGLERVRTLLGKPMTINSGYRSPTVNRAVGGTGTSAHCLGYAR